MSNDEQHTPTDTDSTDGADISALFAAMVGAGGAEVLNTETERVLRAVVRKRLTAVIEAAVAPAFDRHLDAAAREQIDQAADDMVLDHIASAAAGHPDTDPAAEPEPELVFDNVAEFVHTKLAYSYRREVESGISRKWCPQWWKHEEAASRLESLWRAWEHLRLDPATGMSVWWRDHADPHMAQLMDPEGPFKNCSVRHGHGGTEGPLPPLPCTPEPSGLFDLVLPAENGDAIAPAEYTDDGVLQ